MFHIALSLGNCVFLWKILPPVSPARFPSPEHAFGCAGTIPLTAEISGKEGYSSQVNNKPSYKGRIGLKQIFLFHRETPLTVIGANSRDRVNLSKLYYSIRMKWK